MKPILSFAISVAAAAASLYAACLPAATTSPSATVPAI